MKTCPACQKQVGVRTKQCECGHTFSSSTPAVQAGSAPMSLEQALKDSVATVKSIVADVEQRQAPPASKSSIPAPSPRKTSIVYDNNHGGVIAVPAGACPVKPKGSGDDEIAEWTVDVYSSGRYMPEAVVYFARQFWDINGKDFPRIKGIILKALSPGEAADPGES
jgi:hypothetical protein